MRRHEFLLEGAAKALAWMETAPVYVGGATIPIHVDDEYVEETRYTDDVDCMVDVVTPLQLKQLEDALRAHGLRHDVDSGVICRWLTEDDIPLDVMPTNGRGYGHSTTWLPTATQNTFNCLRRS